MYTREIYILIKIILKYIQLDTRSACQKRGKCNDLHHERKTILYLIEMANFDKGTCRESTPS